MGKRINWAKRKGTERWQRKNEAWLIRSFEVYGYVKGADGIIRASIESLIRGAEEVGKQINADERGVVRS
ncbi:MAG: hypothetical protein AABY22_36155 [Nanoarchaeota archaeon]